MSLLNDASLVLVPSGYKEDVVYCQKPTDGSGDLTFTRASTATRVNSAGLIEKERTNLLLQSNTFDTTWSTVNASVTGGQSGYDGSSDAWELKNNSGGTNTSRVQQLLTESSGVYSFSVYAKAGNVNYLRILSNESSNIPVAWFDLTDGNVYNSSNTIHTHSENVGGGWYRCTITFNNSSTGCYLYPTSVAGSTLSGNGEYIYIQDAQLEQSLVATDYIPTTTAAVSVGMTDDVPRVDYSGGGCPSLLLEPQRTNLVPFSEYFDGWSIKSGATATSNSIISPEGLQNTSTISATNALTNYIGQNCTFAASTKYSYSIFIKNGTSSKMRLQVYDSSQYATIEFDQSDSISYSVNLDSYDFVDYSNGWRRVIITFTTSASASSGYIQIYPDRNGNNEYLYAYGGMLEAGSYPTSYIPTYGVSSTRVQDACYKTGISSLIGQTEGTIFIQVNSNEHISELSDNTSANRIVFYTDGSDYLRNLIRASSSTSSNIQTNTTIQAGDKIALAYANNDSVIYKNGVQIGSDTSVTIPATSKVNVGSDYNESLSTTNSVNQFILFSTRLTDTELAALTTL